MGFGTAIASGVKTAASAIASGTKTAAGAVSSGAKTAGNQIFDFFDKMQADNYVIKAQFWLETAKDDKNVPLYDFFSVDINPSTISLSVQDGAIKEQGNKPEKTVRLATSKSQFTSTKPGSVVDAVKAEASKGDKEEVAGPPTMQREKVPYDRERTTKQNSVTVSMELIFDMLRRWDRVLGIKNFVDDEFFDESASDLTNSFKGGYSRSKQKLKLKKQMKEANKAINEQAKDAQKKSGVGYGTKIKNAIASGAQGAWSGLKSGGKNLLLNRIAGENYESKLRTLNLLHDTSSYAKLEDAFKQQNDVVFKWGPMFFSGKIDKLSSEFTVFSKAGSPLRAKTQISLDLRSYSNLEKDSTGIDIGAYIDENFKEMDLTRQSSVADQKANIADKLQSLAP